MGFGEVFCIPFVWPDKIAHTCRLFTIPFNTFERINMGFVGYYNFKSHIFPRFLFGHPPNPGHYQDCSGILLTFA